MIEFFVVKDDEKTLFFKDYPDIVRINDDIIEWTGYPIDFGDFKGIKDIIESMDGIQRMVPFSVPKKVSIDKESFIVR